MIPHRRSRFAGLVTFAIVTAISAQLVAGPRNVQVLPIDGNADAPTRAKLTASMQKLARVIEGQVKPGATTFADAAAAAGCDAASPTCAESVRTLLGVDELVYGTATVQGNQLTLVVHRKSEKGPPREITATIATSEPPDRMEAKVLPLFSGSSPPASACSDGSAPDPTGACAVTPVVKDCPEGTQRTPEGTCAAAPPPTTCPEGATPNLDGTCPAVQARKVNSDRALAIGATAGGGLLFVVGLGLWQSKSKLQTQIDNHPTDTVFELQDLKRLEDKAASRALFGNVLVFGGAALAGVGIWLLVRKPHGGAVVTPTPIEGGAAVTVTWGLR